MNKLGTTERLLILGIINFLLYYALFMVGINPIWNKISEDKVVLQDLQTQYDENLNTINSKSTYEATIVSLTEERADLFQNSFPDAETENIYAYMVKLAKSSQLNIASVNIAQDVQVITDENGLETPTGLKNNNITVNLSGSYNNIMGYVKNIEDVKKTSLLTALTLSPGDGGMSSTLNYTFLTTDKGEEDTDSIFDYNFSQATGNSQLFG